MKSERGGLLVSVVAALTIGCVGVAFSWLTASQAILLDGAFNLTYFLTALLTLRVSQLVARPDTEEFPLGYGFFEPLINGFKGVLILGISLLALFDAVGALLGAGRQIEIGPAIGYGVFATIACSATAFFLRRAHRNTGSPLLRTDAEGWTVNAAISAAVLITFCAVPVVASIGWTAAVPYVDPFLVTIVVLISIGVPIRIGWSALMELVNRAPPAPVRQRVLGLVESALKDVPVQKLYVRIIQPGRTRFVAASVVVPKDHHLQQGLSELDAIRERVEAALLSDYPQTIADVSFTTNERWARPTSIIEVAAAAPPAGHT